MTDRKTWMYVNKSVLNYDHIIKICEENKYGGGTMVVIHQTDDKKEIIDNTTLEEFFQNEVQR